MQNNTQKYNFKSFGQAIKSAREKKGLTRKELAAQIHLSLRYIASIENSGQPPSLQVFYRLVTHLDMSVDQLFFPEKATAKTTQRCGHDITFTIGIFAVNIIIGGIIGFFILAWKLAVAAWYIPLTIYRLVTAGNRNDIDIY